MHLSLHSDYALRVLLYLGAHPGDMVSTAAISEAYRISRHHLVRVIQTLGEAGYVTVMPGRAGGVTLARDPAAISLGALVRSAEPSLRLVECFDKSTNTCPIAGACALEGVLRSALEAFVAELDRHTLAELLTPNRARRLVQLLGPAAAAEEAATPSRPAKRSADRAPRAQTPQSHP